MKKFVGLFLLFGFNTVFAQDTIRFTKALMVSSNSRYGREAIYTDVLAWKMYNGNLSAPQTGSVFNVNENGDTRADTTIHGSFISS